MRTIARALATTSLDGAGRVLLPFLDDVLAEARKNLLTVHEALADIHDYVHGWRELLEGDL